MNSLNRRHIVAVFLVVLVTLGLTVLISASPPPESAPTMQSVPGPQVLLVFDPAATPHYLPPPAQAELGAQTANITVNYNPSSCASSGLSTTPWPAQAQTAFEFAVSIWETLITSNQTTVVDACWTTLGPGILGGAGTTTVHQDFTNAPIADTWYPAALANAIANTDINGGTAEIFAAFSSTFDWYFGIDGNTPLDKVDFASVVLHEVGHGLGFFGFGSVSGGTGSIGFMSFPGVYDRFTEDGSGTALLSYANPSTALGTALTGGAGGVFFDGPNANAANGGSRVPLYAPGTWSQGSSYSHLAESYNGTPNSLMTFALGNGEAEHNPGPVTLGMFRDMGWNVATAPDLAIVKEVIGSSTPSPGDPITFTLTIANNGSATATGVVVTDTIPAGILTTTTTSSIGAVPRGGTTYVWDLPNLASGASGVITIFGTISPTLPLDFVIVNKATISGNEAETNTGNNSSTALVGGSRTYLPLVVRQYSSGGGTTCTPDPPGESNNVAGALTISSGQTATGQVDDSDWDDVFKIYVLANQQVTISMNGTGVGGPGDADLYLYPPSATDVNTDPAVDSSTSGGNTELIQGTALVEGFWYVDVFDAVDGDGGTCYNVTVTLSSASSNATRPFDLTGDIQGRDRRQK